MSLGVLGALLESSPEFLRLSSALGRSRFGSRLQVLSEAAPFGLAEVHKVFGSPMLVVAPRPEDARRLYEQVLLWAGDESTVLHFPETETLPFERLVPDVDTSQNRIRTLWALTQEDGPPPMVIASAAAVAQKTIGREALEDSVQTLSRGLRVDLEEMVDSWRRMGYRIEPTVDVPGLVGRRGGIVDIYPIASEAPARIELWGDEIDSIRHFDHETQRSTDMAESVTVIPARETLPGLVDREQLDRMLGAIDMSGCSAETRDRISGEIDMLLEGMEAEDIDFYAGFFNTGSLLDYFPDDALLVTVRPNEVAEAAWENDERTHELRQVKERRRELPYGFPSSHLLNREVDERAAHIGRRMDVTPWGAEDLTHDGGYALPVSSPPDFLGNLQSFVDEAESLANEGHRVVVVSSASKRIEEVMGELGVTAQAVERLDEVPRPGSITLVQAWGAGLSDGVVLTIDGRRLAVFSDSEIFGMTKLRRTSRRRAAKRDAMLSELTPGDYVVHVEHGVGRFVGSGRASQDEGDREYLILEYARGDQIYVPMEHVDRITPYVAPMEKPPSLTRLGTQEWKRAKERVAQSTREMAAELLSLYASRELAEGHAYTPDTPWQAELESSFPYEETRDQQETIVQVKSDMEHPVPMDRLVCGDVGYGKTEVALRAAFKAVMGGKQVAVLVPTTVLAQQHYSTFSERLQAFPVSVEVLSRFRTDAEQRRVVEGLAGGKVDVCIGTHRLVQKDIAFKDLGLVIVDEEQRFGVAHKERLKEMRREVDVLTLTATPIPRTLHLSLAGVRDMSRIETPPEERLPIRTYVSEFSDELIREAILRELDRQGQVYFLHNRVHSIDYMAGYIRRLVPEAEVGVAHGQMPESRLEETMLAFSEGKMDVLVCTTIIESGLDIPNVNTLIVDRADTFGLSQLYQLRGRVGRGARRAYSYLLIPKARSLTETAEKRLKTMLAATELGAGFRIAMTDLEIRGAGSILGAHQSGHIHAVGFDLYSRLLGEAVEALRAQREFVEAGDVSAAEPAPKLAPASVDLGIPANIPESYVADLATRIGVYRRLVGLGDAAASQAIEDELRDRFGPLPWQVQNLIYVARLRAAGAGAGVRSITKNGERIVLQLHDEIGGARRALQRRLERGVEAGHSQVRLDLEALSEGWQGPLMRTVEALSDFRTRVVALAAVAGH
jgi:transcription-repair coupling factor (superfamily II helicase)